MPLLTRLDRNRRPSGALCALCALFLCGSVATQPTPSSPGAPLTGGQPSPATPDSGASSQPTIVPGWQEEPIPLLICAAPGTQQAGQVWVLAVEREAATTCSFQVVFSYPVQVSQVVLDVSAGAWEVEVLTGSAVGRLESQQKMSSSDMVPAAPLPGNTTAQLPGHSQGGWANLTITASGPCIRHLLIRLTSTVAPTNLAQWPLKPRLLRLHTSPQPAACNRPQGSSGISAAIRADDSLGWTGPVLFPPEVVMPPVQPPPGAIQSGPQLLAPPVSNMVTTSVSARAGESKPKGPKSRAMQILLPTLCTIFGVAALACIARATYNCGLQRRLHQDRLAQVQQEDADIAAGGMMYGVVGSGVSPPHAARGSAAPKGGKRGVAQRMPSTIPEEDDGDCEAPPTHGLTWVQPWLGQPPPAAAPMVPQNIAGSCVPIQSQPGQLAEAPAPASTSPPTGMHGSTDHSGSAAATSAGEAAVVASGPGALGLHGLMPLYPPASGRVRRKCRTIVSDHTWLPLRPGSGPLAHARYATLTSATSSSPCYTSSDTTAAASQNNLSSPATPSDLGGAGAGEETRSSSTLVARGSGGRDSAGGKDGDVDSGSRKVPSVRKMGDSGYSEAGMLILDGESSLLSAHGLSGLPDVHVVRLVSVRCSRGQTVRVYEGVWRGKAVAVVQMPLHEPQLESTGHAVIMARVEALRVLATHTQLANHVNLVPVYKCQVRQMPSSGEAVSAWVEPWLCPALARAGRPDTWHWELQVALGWCSGVSLRTALVAGWAAKQREGEQQQGLRQGAGVAAGVSVAEPAGPGVLWAGSLQEQLLTALDIASGLQELHAHNVLHTELCLARVMLQPCALDVRGWTARLVCRGLAVQDPDGSDVLPGVHHGDPSHTAPEVRSHGRVSPASDVFALGCCLYELMVGTPLPQQQQPGASQQPLSRQQSAVQHHPPVLPQQQDSCKVAEPTTSPEAISAPLITNTPEPAASGSTCTMSAMDASGHQAPVAAAADAMPAPPFAAAIDKLASPTPTPWPMPVPQLHPAPPPPPRRSSSKRLRAPQKPWLPQFPSDAPPRLVALINACISGNPYTRPSAADVVTALKGMLEEEEGAA